MDDGDGKLELWIWREIVSGSALPLYRGIRRGAEWDF